jgi:urate oxidase
MSLSLAHDRYGKSGIRVVKIDRRTDRHGLKDMTVSVMFEGDFDSAHIDGDNSRVLPTDTMKNTVYALAQDHGDRDIEHFALALARHLVHENPQAATVEVAIEEHLWSRITIGGRPQGNAFSRAGAERRTTRVTGTREGKLVVHAGIADLLLMKTAKSGFAGYIRDEFTTLPETRDRLLATSLTANWRYGWIEVPFGVHWQQVRQEIMSAFAEHESRSVQHTLYAMAQAALEQCPAIAEIGFSLPNRHHLLVDLSAFGRTNDNEVFVATEEPFGLIEATVSRSELDGAGVDEE